jgi:hypothetical protein
MRFIISKFYKNKFSYFINPPKPHTFSNEILESTFNPLKLITRKKLAIAFFLPIFIYTLKIYILPLLINLLTPLNFLAYGIFGILSLIISSMILFFLEEKLLIIGDNLKSLEDLKQFVLNFMNSKGESSKSGEQSSRRGRVITDSDYESDNSNKRFHSPINEIETDDIESNVSKLINSDLPIFTKCIKNLSNEEIAETLNTIDYMKEQYKKSNVPSAKGQIVELSIKEGVCMNQLEKNLSNEDVKGKGKEVDGGDDTKGKGKGKEVDKNN